MNEKVLKTLEYNKILNQLSEYACSPEAKKRCLALRQRHFKNARLFCENTA